jgi:hypothetical protein
MDKNRELDCYLAEHVMGWRWGEEFISFAAGSRKVLLPPKDSRFGGKVIPGYSTDERLAFREVVAKMVEWFPDLEFTLNMWATGPQKWEAIFTVGNDDFQAYADTPALAICLAARAAIEGGQP